MRGGDEQKQQKGGSKKVINAGEQKSKGNKKAMWSKR